MMLAQKGLLVETEGSDNERLVLDIIRMTIHNGPGIRTLILLKGCPLHCVWCSTPESQESGPELSVRPDKCIQCGQCESICPVDAIDCTKEVLKVNRSLCTCCGKCVTVCPCDALILLGQSLSIHRICQEVSRDKIFFKHSGGGVTISGGEALLDAQYMVKLLKALKKEEISVGIDTCGYVPGTTIEAVLPYVEFFLWDIKHMNHTRHIELTGVSNDIILRNLHFVSERKVPIYIRIPVIPGYNDSEENIKATCEFVRNLPSLVEVDLLPVHHLGKARYESLNRVYPIADVLLMPEAKLQTLKDLVASYGLKACIVG
jgi:pyruvate formate lyase activating enzyme